VTAIPSPTSFTYSNGGVDATAGAAGTAATIWNGSFYVQSVPTTTTFTYYNLGPNTTGATAGGQCVPSGQCIPGQHGVSVAFLTRQGYITKPSPVTTFVANGGQYVVVSDLPIGPSNVVGRVILFTGSGRRGLFLHPRTGTVRGRELRHLDRDGGQRQHLDHGGARLRRRDAVRRAGRGHRRQRPVRAGGARGMPRGLRLRRPDVLVGRAQQDPEPAEHGIRRRLALGDSDGASWAGRWMSPAARS
jgi:hypothetical protein